MTNETNNNGTILVRYKNETIPVPAAYSREQIKASMISLYPELRDAAILENPDGSLAFYVEAGDKGAEDESTPAETPATILVRYKNETIPVPGAYSREQIKASMISLYPELRDAAILENPDGSLSFYVEAGDKGAEDESTPAETPATILVRYKNETIPVPGAYSREQIKASMISLYPELRDAAILENPDGSLSFYVEAGDKGSLN